MNTTTDHQPREHAVLCRRCMKHQTFAVTAICSDCAPKAA